MNNLKFRRQFLLTPIECKDLNEWQTERIADYFLYVHPDCGLIKVSGNNDVFLVGYLLDPHYPQKNSASILKDFAQEKDINNFHEILHKLIGRFVLIIKMEQEILFYNDACGLKTFYYTKKSGKLFAASQPLLIDKVLKLTKTASYDEYFNSDYVAKHIEHWLPSGITLYKNVFHLTPNHYLLLSEYEQKRYWPNKKIQKIEYKEALFQFVDLFKRIMITANNHMNLALSLTAGWDSRLILSSSKDFHQDVLYYTLKYRNMDAKHMDVKIPMSLSKSLNLNYCVLNCKKGITNEFSTVYKQNTDMSHVNDWGLIAYGLFSTYPQKKVAVKGNCSEIGRGRKVYYPNERNEKILSENIFLQPEKGWEKMHFIRQRVKEWFDETKSEEVNNGYNLADLFYWEHRMGSWQAQSQLEWDIAQEVFSPFNSRELLDLMLAIDKSYRNASRPLLYKDAIKILWPEVLSEPINPSTPVRKFKNILKSCFGNKIIDTIKK